MRTTSTIPNPALTIKQRKWHLVDAKGQVLGRLCTRVARLLIGKDKAHYTPAVDCGDYVVVINAAEVALTKEKMTTKIYYHHSGYLGGLKKEPYGSLIRRNPDLAIRRAVWGMLPKTRLGRRMITRLKVYAGTEHKHAAQIRPTGESQEQVK